MKVQELIDLIYSNSYYNIYNAEELIGEVNCVAKNLNINEHRWYTVSTRVYKLEDGYVGITGPSQLKSESSIGKIVVVPVMQKNMKKYK